MCALARPAARRAVKANERSMVCAFGSTKRGLREGDEEGGGDGWDELLPVATAG